IRHNGWPTSISSEWIDGIRVYIRPRRVSGAGLHCRLFAACSDQRRDFACRRERSQTALEFKTNRYNPATGNLVFTQAQSAAYNELASYYRKFFSEPSTRFGLRPNAIRHATELRQLTAFLSWS